METRGRGREARASSDETPTPAPAPASRNPFPTPPAPIPTRSRTRRGPTAIPVPPRATRSQRVSRTPASNAPPPHPSSSRRLPQPAPSDLSPTLALADRPRRAQSSRRPSQHPSAIPDPPNRVSRKRTRSSLRRTSPPLPSSSATSSSSAHPHSSAPAGPSAAAASSSRPPKRSRRSHHSTRNLRVTPSRPSSSRGSHPGPTNRHLRAMNSGSGDAPQRSQDSNSHRRDEEGPSSLGSDRAGPTTLQGLLRRLGADLSDIFPGNSGSSHSRLQQLRNSIASPDNNEQQLEALSELCEFLSVGTEESMVSYSVNLFVSPLVNLLRTGANVEIKIYSARALTHMMDALPSSSSAIAINGAAGPLCHNLLAIEYIDLAEQSLSALHKLSVDYPHQIVSANGFQAVLSFIDFFSIGVQRVAASTACNLCRSPRTDAMDMISGVLPIMMRLLDYDDQRIRESAVLGFLRLAEAFRSSSEKMEILCGEEFSLIDKILGLVVPPSPPALSPSSYSSALRLLSFLARGSAKLGIQILSTDSLIVKLKTRLMSDSSVHAMDCLNLADSLLPDVPDPDAPQPPPRTRRPRRSSSSNTVNIAVDVKRREELEKNMGIVLIFGSNLFETLMKFYVSSADSNGRRVSLSVMSKFIDISSQEVLKQVIEKGNDTDSVDQPMTRMRFCPFVAALLGENSSPNEALIGLAMAGSALQKLPSLRDSFFREGVVHEIVRLSSSGSDAEREGDVEQGGRAQDTGASVAAATAERGDNSAVQVTSDQNVINFDVHSMESFWNVVSSSLQVGSSYRVGRSEGVPSRGRPPSRSLLEIRMPSQTMNIIVPKAARSILKAYLGANEDGSLNEDVFRNTSLGRLIDVCKTLGSSCGERDERSAYRSLQSLVKLLLAPERLTVFEVCRSGAMYSLAQFLSPSNVSLKPGRIAALARSLNEDQSGTVFSHLVELALGVLASEEKLPLHISDHPHSSSSGLRHLSQPFKLRLRKAAADEGGAGLRDYSHHVVLIEPLATMASVQEFLWPRVRDVERPNATSSAPGSSRRRGSRGERSDGDGAALPGSESGSGEQDDNGENGEEGFREDAYDVEEMFDMDIENNDDDVVVDEEEEEHNSDGSDDEVSSGDEDMIEHDAGESDENENDVPDQMDVDQLARPVPPFELDHDALGLAPSRGGRSTGPGSTALGVPARNGSEGRQELAFRSYAAALAANMPRMPAGTSGRHEGRAAISSTREDVRRGRVGTSPQNLSFSLNGRKVAHDCSILSAVIQTSGDGRGIGTKLWTDIHTLVYGKYESDGDSGPSQAHDAPDVSGHGASSAEGASSLRRSQRLQERERATSSEVRKTALKGPSHETLSKVSIARDVMPIPSFASLSDLPSTVSDVLDVLRHLYWMFKRLQDRPVQVDGSKMEAVYLEICDNVDFHSRKLSAKILRQLSDPLALCGGVIPSWCFSVAREASFIVPFETRRILFQSTSLGVSRALSLLQTRMEMSGIANHQRGTRNLRDEGRVGRLQRRKVRIHRHRILESAIKVMNIYASHNSLLEVQYFDEAGIGLGPTLEFYTMASRELQRVDLRLWRGSSDKISKPKEIGGSVSAAVRINNALMSSTWTSSGKRRSRRHSNPSTSTNEGQNDDEPPAFVIPTGRGLFPSCLPMFPTESEKHATETTTALFGFVGRLMGKAMVDGRLLDLRLSETFCRLVMAYCRLIYEQKKSGEMDVEGDKHVDGSCRKFSIDTELDKIDRQDVWDLFTAGTSSMRLLEDVDSQLAMSLKTIVGMMEEGGKENIDMLCLTFVLPGDDNIELIEDGSNVDVTWRNADEFVRRVVYHVLFGGVYQQAEALLRGLGEVIDPTQLLMFKSNELELLTCGPPFERWSIEFLIEATRCDHGYSHESSAVMFFLRILSEMDQDDQQRFVLFTTGAPALPLGGLRNLHPRLTIVRRTPEAGRSPDECLPTVMTCTNYFKLPDYTSFEVAKKQVMYAVREGQRSFHLS